MDDQSVSCILEMAEDRHITVIVKPGCSVADVHDMLRMLPPDGHFDHLTFVDDDEDLP
jgi:hypothetical protein